MNLLRLLKIKKNQEFRHSKRIVEDDKRKNSRMKEKIGKEIFMEKL